MALAITRTEFSARALRAAAAKVKDAKAARRMLAIALVMEGVDRKAAAESCGMDRQTLRDWVHRYNAEGLEGLSNRRTAGPAPRLSPEQKAELVRMVREGPDPATDSIFDTYEEIVTRCCDAWNFFANDTATVRSITNREYTKAVRN